MARKQSAPVAPGDLAVNGGRPAVDRLDGARAPKIGVEEFMDLARLWGFSLAARQRIYAAVREEDLGAGPWLMRYHKGGPSAVDELEALARRLFDVPYALAVHSGTSALETALAACGVGPGTEVIVPGFTFVATASAVVHAHAIPVICEIGPALTMDPGDLEQKITPRTRAVIPVHMLGRPADMAAVMAVASRHGLSVIEDVAQAAGGSFGGQRLGTVGDVGCFSLNSHKVVGAGEAGLLVTSSQELYVRALNYHDTVASSRPGYPDHWPRERVVCGTNLRMSELEGAVNQAQLAKMDDLIARYRRNRELVIGHLRGHEGVSVHPPCDPAGDVGYQLPFFLPSAEQCETVVNALAAEGLPAHRYEADDDHVYPGWHAVLARRTASASGCPRTLDLIGRLAVVDVSPWWSAADCELIARAVTKVLGAFYSPADLPWKN